jgi:hypothetical protein
LSHRHYPSPLRFIAKDQPYYQKLDDNTFLSGEVNQLFQPQERSKNQDHGAQE